MRVRVRTVGSSISPAKWAWRLTCPLHNTHIYKHTHAWFLALWPPSLGLGFALVATPSFSLFPLGKGEFGGWEFGAVVLKQLVPACISCESAWAWMPGHSWFQLPAMHTIGSCRLLDSCTHIVFLYPHWIPGTWLWPCPTPAGSGIWETRSSWEVSCSAFEVKKIFWKIIEFCMLLPLRQSVVQG